MWIPRIRRAAPSEDPAPVTLTLYGRQNCHLCDEAKDALEKLRARVTFRLVERDVDDDPIWRDAWGDEVPVGFIGERKVFKYRVDPAKLERALLSDR